MKSRLALLSATALLAACSSTPPGPEQGGAPVEERSPNARDINANPPVQQVLPDRTGNPLAALKDPNSILSKRSVFFDYDSYSIKEDARGLVEAHAKFLVANPSIKMLIQGNTDERGSREYNLALGQKRSDALKKALILLGARETQIESVSLGKEKPRNEGHDESAYSENRRADMLYTGEF